MSLYPGYQTRQIAKSFQGILKAEYGLLCGELSTQNKNSISLRYIFFNIKV